MIIVYSTFPALEEAQKIARHLVERKLVACANILSPHTAIYEWRGQMEEGQEVAALFKTRAELFGKVEEAIKSLHSYDVPCIVSWDIEKGHAPFLAWIEEQAK